ncbi:MAG: SWF/SNF helicase family protein, partial [Nitrospirae bacterium]|nr:SWF/SNF helicase family protein [Nitrospirota bacterium]
GRRALLLTATPRNKSAWDVYHQIKLFHPDDKTDLPIDPPDLKLYFRAIEQNRKKLPDLLVNILIRRTRNHILRWYGFDAETHQPVNPARYKEYLNGQKKAYVIVGGRHQFFPRRDLETIEYSIEATYQGLYEKIRTALGKPGRRTPGNVNPDELTYARYGLWNYVKPEKQKKPPYNDLQRAGTNLRGLMRILLFKRFESSVYAFRETLKRLLRIHETFLFSLEQNIVPAGDDAQDLLYESDQMAETDLLDALRAATGKYSLEDFEADPLMGHVRQDIEILRKMLQWVDSITPDRDAKLQTLLQWRGRTPLSEGKCLIFTQYADTARYLHENLNPGGDRPDIDVIYSGDKSKARVVGRFAPKANPEYRFGPGEMELTTVIATDVLSEGLNLQDCDKIINYDLHWNPVRLIQRFGRIDRIGTEHDAVYAFNFLPETELERNLGLRQKLANRIQEIHDTIGEDAAILDNTEQLNEDAMYAIYEKKGSHLNLLEDEEEEFIDLNEAEEILRQLRKEDPVEFERIANLRDGIRTGRDSETKGVYVFCQAGRYQQLFLVGPGGEVMTRDIPRIIGEIKCSPDLPSLPLPPGYNEAVMRVKRQFVEEVTHRETERAHTLSLTHGQRYVLRELRMLFGVTADEDIRGQITILEKAFRGPLTRAIHRELNLLRRNSVSGESLRKSLLRIYDQHNLRDWIDRRKVEDSENEVPRIICSEALL